MKHKKFILGRLFYNNKFLIFFSVLASIVLWGCMVSTDTQDHPRPITNVPVKVELSTTAQSNGLKIFSQTNTTVTVYVKGNSMVVNQLKAADLEVVAPLAANITTPGAYTLPLTVRNSSQNANNLSAYTVSSVYPQQVLVSVDRYREKTFQIESNIKYKSGYKADPSYFVGSPVLSTDTVTISGPEKQVVQVNRAAFEYQINDTLTETKNFTETLNLYDANDNKIEKADLTINPQKVDVSIPVLPREVIPITAAFTNKPAGLSLNPSQITISPSTIEIAGPKDVLSNIGSSISLNPIDFSAVSLSNNTFDADVELPSTCKNLSNIPTAKVSIDLSGMVTRQMSVSNIVVKNLSAEKNASVKTKSLTVTVIGPPEEISKLTDSNITAQVDMSGKENFSGPTEMPATFSISNASSSWVSGSYMVNLTVTQKKS
jgi:YbbR domain-containing protein